MRIKFNRKNTYLRLKADTDKDIAFIKNFRDHCSSMVEKGTSVQDEGGK